jgi:hypothetical protein
VNFSQQSPRVCLCLSGSKQDSAPQNVKALQGRSLKAPSIWPGRWFQQALAQSCKQQQGCRMVKKGRVEARGLEKGPAAPVKGDGKCAQQPSSCLVFGR